MSSGKSSSVQLGDRIRQKWFALKRLLFPAVREQYRLDRLTGPIGYWDAIQRYQLGFLVGRGLEPHHTFLDIGCGPLSGGLTLIPYLQPGHYVGIDVREEPIAEAYRQLVKAGLVGKNPLLAVSSTFGRDELDGWTFDYIWASQVLYHLDEDGIDACFEQAASRMNGDSKFFGDIIGTPNKVKPDSRWNGFTFHLHSFDTIKALAAKQGLTARRLGKLSDCGYPDEIALKTSDMIEFRLAAPAGDFEFPSDKLQGRS